MKKSDFIDLLCCFECGAELKIDNDKLNCSQCWKSFTSTDRMAVLLPQSSIDNQYLMNYLEHYSNDAEIFDYFQKRECQATEHDERRVREYILSLLDGNEKTVLDVGSGSAWVAKYLSEKNIVVSFDIAKKNIELALSAIPNKTHFGVVGDALNPPFKNERFDYIIASEVIEHIVKPKDFIDNLIKLLKPEGTLIISTPYKEVLHYSQCIHCNQMTPKNAHIHSFDEHILKSFSNEITSETKQYIFGNKALIILRTHVILKYLPLFLWKVIDKIVNVLINKPSHIIISYRRKK